MQENNDNSLDARDNPGEFVEALMQDEALEVDRLEQIRILMYSHDTFGLGHLRRCRAIAHAIVEQFKGVSVLIISGSQIAGAFDFRARVDFVKIPSVIKLYNGEYDSIGEYIDIDEILEMRKLIIQRTAEVFQPDIFIADKEPLGLKGELLPTLEMLRKKNCMTVMGLRDVMDSPRLLKDEWEKSNMIGNIDALYDRVWIYGPEKFWNPLKGFDLPPSVSEKLNFVGFLEREATASAELDGYSLPDEYILVTAGGGGDGVGLMEQVLAARESDTSADFPIVMVLGPFMKSESREKIRIRASHLANITVVDFESHMELLIQNATAIVGMCGYNTFCEAMSFDKRVLFVPRTTPREEQLIRATRARDLYLCKMLLPEEAAIPSKMAQMLRELPSIPRPSEQLTADNMAGLQNICIDVAALSSRLRNKSETADMEVVA